MTELLLASILSCKDGYWIIDGIWDTNLGVSDQLELVETVLESMPDDCNPDEFEGRKINSML